MITLDHILSALEDDIDPGLVSDKALAELRGVGTLLPAEMCHEIMVESYLHNDQLIMFYVASDFLVTCRRRLSRSGGDIENSEVGISPACL